MNLWWLIHLPPVAKKKGPKKPRPSNEEIRLRILQLLYEEHERSGTLRRYLWSDLRMKVRNELSFDPPETTRNLDYLIQNDWIHEERQPYEGLYRKEKKTYGISAKAIDLFQGDSMFSSGLSIQGMVVAGDNNIIQIGANILVQTQYQDLQESLSALLQWAILSDDLLDEQKIQLAADIKALQAQLIKPEQDETLLNRLRSKISWVGDVASLSNLFLKVTEYWPW